MKKSLKYNLSHRKAARQLINGALLSTVLASSAFAEGVALGTLAFEIEGLDLDTDTVISDLSPIDTAGADIKIAYNALRSTAAVVFPTGTEGIELAFVANVGFDGITAESLTSLTFQAEPVDLPFTASDTVVVKTDAGAFYKLGNAIESSDSVTFNYAPLQ